LILAALYNGPLDAGEKALSSLRELGFAGHPIIPLSSIIC